MQILFICTGCNYISYFKQIEKSSFFNYFFQHARFICGSGMDGSLHEIEVHNRSNGFLSFIRLIGTVYFKKHLPSYISIDGHKTPIQSYNGIDSFLPPNERHKKWIERIRSIVADRIMTEEQCVPSYTSLWRHRLQSCWTASLWHISRYLR